MSPSFVLHPPLYADVLTYTWFMADPEVTVWLDDRCQRPVLFHHALAFVLGEAWCRLAIKCEGRFVGLCGLEDYDPANARAHFFIVLGDRALWSRGLGTAVTQALLTIGFRDLGLRRIDSNLLAPNHASRRLHARVGFVEEGCQRQVAWRRGAWVDRILLGLLREDWLRQGAASAG